MKNGIQEEIVQYDRAFKIFTRPLKPRVCREQSVNNKYRCKYLLTPTPFRQGEIGRYQIGFKQNKNKTNPIFNLHH